MVTQPAELLRVSGLGKTYSYKSGSFAKKAELKAARDVSFRLDTGRVYALVGESGCGKSTVARLVLRLIEPTAGRIFYKNEDITSLGGKALKAFRRSVQIVFQDPMASLNPRMTIHDTLTEPLKIHALTSGTGLKERAIELLDSVGLEAGALNRYPHEFSGGQRQRICIARALAVSPELLVADEPLSALDVSIQAQIINILQNLKAERGLSYLFISHDLRVVRYLSDTVGVMYLGRLVEESATEELYSTPLHPYTRSLLESAPELDFSRRQQRSVLHGDVPSPIDIPPGCPFHPRCPEKFGPCSTDVPVYKEQRENPGRLVSCHLYA